MSRQKPRRVGETPIALDAPQVLIHLADPAWGRPSSSGARPRTRDADSTKPNSTNQARGLFHVVGARRVTNSQEYNGIFARHIQKECGVRSANGKRRSFIAKGINAALLRTMNRYVTMSGTRLYRSSEVDLNSVAFDVGRVVELVAISDCGDQSFRGTGYRLSSAAIITARHVTAGAAEIYVRFPLTRDSETWLKVVNTWFPKSAACDIALVYIGDEETDVPPVQIGRLGRGSGTFSWTAIGFPLFKLRQACAPAGDRALAFRDSEGLTGTINSSSNLREGTYSAHIETTIPDPSAIQQVADAQTPWEGISGAAVWIGEHLVGIVSRHHLAEGPGTLTVMPLESLFGDAVGLPEEVARSSNLPSRHDELEIIPALASDAKLILAAHANEVRSFAPDELVGRAAEMQRFADFCADNAFYLWWQARPWAGKTALAAWIAAHPPPGTEFVSFFITTRRPNQNDSFSYLTGVTEQLMAIAGRDSSPVTSVSGRHGEYLLLLTEAVKAARARGNRLVLLVDGLDEDRTALGTSIAGLLPAERLQGLRVLVTSRPQLSLPRDVDENHPLRHARVERLTESEGALDIGRRALAELHAQLRGSELVLQILAFVAASGGGLSVGDLAKLLNFARDARIPLALVQLRQVLEEELSRTLQLASLEADREEIIFAHDTLREVTESTLADVLAQYGMLIDEWVNTFRSQRWPDTTPTYPLVTYARRLEVSQRWDRLCEFTLDLHRQHRLRMHFGTHNISSGEHERLLRQASTHPQHWADRIVRLAIGLNILKARTDAIPEEIPLTWTRLGDMRRAALLVQGLPDYTAVRTLIEMLAIVRATGDLAVVGELREQAESLVNARVGYYSDGPSSKRQDLVNVAIAAGDIEGATDVWNEMKGTAIYEFTAWRVIRATAETDFDSALEIAKALDSWTACNALHQLRSLAKNSADRSALQKLFDAARAPDPAKENSKAEWLTLVAVLAIDLEVKDAGEHLTRALSALSEGGITWFTLFDTLKSLCEVTRGTSHEARMRTALRRAVEWAVESARSSDAALSSADKIIACAIALQDFELAREVIELMKASDRNWELARLCCAGAEAGDMAAAESFAHQIDDADKREVALMRARSAPLKRDNPHASEIDSRLEFGIDDEKPEPVVIERIRQSLLARDHSEIRSIIGGIPAQEASKIAAVAAYIAVLDGDNSRARDWLGVADEYNVKGSGSERWQFMALAAAASAGGRGDGDLPELMDRFDTYRTKKPTSVNYLLQDAAMYAALLDQVSVAERFIALIENQRDQNTAWTDLVQELSYLGATTPAVEMAGAFRDPEVTWATLVLVPWLKSHIDRVERSVAVSSLRRLVEVAESDADMASASGLLADGLKLANRIGVTEINARIHEIVRRLRRRVDLSVPDGLQLGAVIAECLALCGANDSAKAMLDAVEARIDELGDDDVVDNGVLDAWQGLAHACAVIGDFNRSDRLEEHMSFMDKTFRSTFVGEFAHLGRFDDAESFVASHSGDTRFDDIPKREREVLLALVEAYAERGRFTEAQNAAQRIPEREFDRAKADRTIMTNAVVVKNEELAYRMLVEMVQGPKWMQAVMIMDRIDPRIGDTLVNEMMRQIEVEGEDIGA